MWEEALLIYQMIIFGRHKIQDNYKSELFVIVSKHKEPYVYTICQVCGSLVHTIYWQ